MRSDYSGHFYAFRSLIKCKLNPVYRLYSKRTKTFVGPKNLQIMYVSVSSVL